MVDPINITNYNLTKEQLEETILFWVCAAGKNGVTAAKSLDNLLNKLKARFGEHSPFILIDKVGMHAALADLMKESGIGCYNAKAITFAQLVSSAIDLRECTVDELMRIKGIGPKTARAFIVHSRPNQRVAALDTHLLKFLRHQGIITPKSTPTGKKYLELEAAFLSICDIRGLNYADTDLEIWKHYRENPEVKFDIERYTNDYHQYCTIGCSC